MIPPNLNFVMKPREEGVRGREEGKIGRRGRKEAGKRKGGKRKRTLLFKQVYQIPRTFQSNRN